MQLNQGALGSDLHSEINITPLVDVVLVLLIIFMVVVPLLVEGYNVDIPRSSADSVPAQPAESQLILSIGPSACRIFEPPAGEGLPEDCRVTLGDQKIPAAELRARVAEMLGRQPPEKRVLFLAADDRLNYEGVLRIIDLAKSGVEDLKIEFIRIEVVAW
jgi:biopolymer transport protein ExbD